MESAVVNARVSAAKRDAAKGILDSLGATTSELINSAYDYLLQTGKLPSAMPAEGLSRGGDEMDRMADFEEYVSRSTLDIDWGVDAGVDYRALIARGKQADYERLA